VSLDKSLHINGQLDGGGGPNCTSSACHGAATTNRRNAVADFSLQSHHVGIGSSMGGSLSDNDCWVCHAEYDVTQSSTGTLHMNNKIDLRDADNNAAYYQYDSDAVAALGTSGANSGSVVWKEEMSGRRSRCPTTPSAPPTSPATPRVPAARRGSIGSASAATTPTVRARREPWARRARRR
jgi:hypothetical protein